MFKLIITMVTSVFYALIFQQVSESKEFEKKTDPIGWTLAESSVLQEKFVEAMKAASQSWGGGDWNIRLSQCMSENSWLLTRGMKAGIIKHGLEGDLVFWKVLEEDTESFENVMNLCQDKLAANLEGEPEQNTTNNQSKSDVEQVKTGPRTETTKMSLEEAKKVTAQLKKETFHPPPRTIRDITRILEGKRRESLAAIKKLQADAEAQTPNSTVEKDLFNFYRTRADAAQLVGRTKQQIEDYRSAIIHGRKGYNKRQINAEEFARTLTGSASVEWQVGSMLRAKDMLKEAQSVAAHSKYPESEQLIISILWTHYFLFRDDLDNARKWLAIAKAGWSREEKNKSYWPVVGWDEIQSQIWAVEGKYSTVTGKLEAGEALVRRAINNFQKHKNVSNYETHIMPKLNLRVYLHYQQMLCENLLLQGRAVEAEIIWRDMVSEAVGAFGRYSNVTADAATGIARALLEQGRYEEADTLAKTSLEIWQTIQAPASSVSLQETYRLLSDIMVLRKNWNEARSLYALVERGLASDPQSRNKLLNQNPSYLLTLFHSNQVDGARIVLKNSYKSKRDALGEQHPETAELGAMLAMVERANGDIQQALQRFQLAMPVLLSRSSRSGDVKTLGTVHEARLALFLEHYIDLLANLFIENPTAPESEKHLSKAFQLSDQARDRTTQGALNKSGARAVAGNHELAKLIRREQDSVHQIGAWLELLSNHMLRPNAEQDPEVVQKLKMDIKQLSTARVAIMEEIETKFPGYANLINPKPISLKSAQDELRSNEALISIYVGENRTYIWAVPRKGSVVFKATEIGRAELAEMVSQLREALEPDAVTLGDIPEFNLKLAHEFYDRFLHGLEDGWKDAKSLLVVSHGPLGHLPFSLLTTKEVQLPPENKTLFESYRSVPWLVRSHLVTVLPSVIALKTLRDIPPRKQTKFSFVAFADPVFSLNQKQIDTTPDTATKSEETEQLGLRGAPITLRGLVQAEKQMEKLNAQLSSLPPLPDTRSEVREIASTLQANMSRDVFLGQAANEHQVKSMDLSRYKVIAFATHGLIPGDLDGLTQPALALSSPEVVGGEEDGLLTMNEILGLKLNADWVVLSACNTGSGEGAGAEAISGLGRAFFYAGARALLVSNWPVETTSAKALTTGLFKRQAANSNLSRAGALRKTMLNLINRGGYKDPESENMVFSYAHPIFWAPFTLVGEGNAIERPIQFKNDTSGSR